MNHKSDSEQYVWAETQRRLIYSFITLGLEMTPEEFIKKWQGITYVELADICEVETTVVYKWLTSNVSKRKTPSKYYQLKLGIASLYFELCRQIDPDILKEYLN